MTAPANTSHNADAVRGVPPMGGFNLTALGLELRRVLRNRRTVIFTLLFPSVFFYLFGMNNPGVRRGGSVVLAYVMISMAVYGAMVGTTAGGAAVAVERSLGWSRQLRLTPLTPVAYISMKVLSAMTLGLVAIMSTFTIGALAGVTLTPQQWALCGLAAWGSSCVFAAFGLFMGFLVPSENVMQFAGPAMAIMALFGGIFIPVDNLPEAVRTIAMFTPMYGVGQLARAPLSGDFTMGAVASVVVWAVIFGSGAMLLFRRDTQRV
ncbi:MAG TPA: ABC transporter permease [Gemmatimonas sp.]|uniref:ABC transporter permease n=1 Tax=Gemmatimonas sp. TaxID=1962908 RepID=UPI002ED7DF19